MKAFPTLSLGARILFNYRTMCDIISPASWLLSLYLYVTTVIIRTTLLFFNRMTGVKLRVNIQTVFSSLRELTHFMSFSYSWNEQRENWHLFFLLYHSFMLCLEGEFSAMLMQAMLLLFCGCFALFSAQTRNCGYSNRIDDLWKRFPVWR